MELIIGYIDLLFKSGIICLIGGLIVIYLAKKKIIMKDNEKGRKNYTKFGNKLILFSIIAILLGIFSMFIIK